MKGLKRHESALGLSILRRVRGGVDWTPQVRNVDKREGRSVGKGLTTDSNNFKKEKSSKRVGCRHLGIGVVRVLIASACGFWHYSRYRYGGFTSESIHHAAIWRHYG